MSLLHIPSASYELSLTLSHLTRKTWSQRRHHTILSLPLQVMQDSPNYIIARTSYRKEARASASSFVCMMSALPSIVYTGKNSAFGDLHT